MFEIRLNESLYHQAQRRAIDLGFADVNAFVADVLGREFDETENFDHLFTPERWATIEAAREQARSGQTTPAADVWERLRGNASQ
ncbi:MAG: hypothetical protein QM811_25620 [Pirellulales bacterium]